MEHKRVVERVERSLDVSLAVADSFFFQLGDLKIF